MGLIAQLWPAWPSQNRPQCTRDSDARKTTRGAGREPDCNHDATGTPADDYLEASCLFRPRQTITATRSLRLTSPNPNHRRSRPMGPVGCVPSNFGERRDQMYLVWGDNVKTWTELPVEESLRMTEGRDTWRNYVHGVANPRTEDG